MSAKQKKIQHSSVSQPEDEGESESKVILPGSSGPACSGVLSSRIIVANFLEESETSREKKHRFEPFAVYYSEAIEMLLVKPPNYIGNELSPPPPHSVQSSSCANMH